jgi:hypothetical protein
MLTRRCFDVDSWILLLCICEVSFSDWSASNFATCGGGIFSLHREASTRLDQAPATTHARHLLLAAISQIQQPAQSCPECLPADSTRHGFQVYNCPGPWSPSHSPSFKKPYAIQSSIQPHHQIQLSTHQKDVSTLPQIRLCTRPSALRPSSP